VEAGDKIAVWLGHLHIPAIVGQAPSGIVYHNQTHGVMTSQSSGEGFFVPLPPISNKVFDPAWWYYARLGMGRPDSPSRKGKAGDEVRRKIDGALATLGEERARVIKRWCEEPRISRTELYRQVEAAVRGATDSPLRDFRVSHSAEPCSPSCDDYWDEAWLPCAFELEQDAYVLGEKGLPSVIKSGEDWRKTHPWRKFTGWLTWENCD
jgi:hypothetical protein